MTRTLALGDFSLSLAVGRGAGRNLSEADARGVALEMPPAAPEPLLFGSRTLLENAASSLTLHAVGESRKGETVSWTVAATPSGPVAAITWALASGTNRPDQLFELPRGPHAVGLFLARWAVESHGGRLTAEAKDGLLRVTLLFSGDRA